MKEWYLLLAYDSDGVQMVQLSEDADFIPSEDWNYQPVHVRKVLILDPYEEAAHTKITLPESQEGEVKVEVA